MQKFDQRYISDELTHLLGKKQEEVGESPYETLLEILRTGWLTHPPHAQKNMIIASTLIRYKRKLSDNEMYSTNMVCFCDIPLSDLAIHVEKYGGFGLSFSKDFIAQKGGGPVHYIPRNASLPPDLPSPHKCKGDYFDDMAKLYEQLGRHLLPYYAGRGSILDMKFPPFDIDHPDAPKNIAAFLEQYPGVGLFIERFFSLHILCYLKFFDHNLPDDSPQNYYFEREWRVFGNIQFVLEDVKRVLIPSEYARRFRDDLPEYFGQLTFVD
jgi:hypothetical protein